MSKVFQVLLMCICMSSAALAIVIDFESAEPESEPLSYTENGVTFTSAVDSLPLYIMAPFPWRATPNGTQVLQGGFTFDPLTWQSKYVPVRAELEMGATLVSVELGDLGDDQDYLFLEIRDAENMLLGRLAPQTPITTGMHPLSLEAPPGTVIKYVLFGGEDSQGTGSTVVADNFTYVPANSPPEVQPSPESQTVEIGIDTIVLIADVSDFDGDLLAYQWLKDGEVLQSGSVQAIAGGETVLLPDLVIAAGDPMFNVGTHSLELSVDDGVNDPVTKTVTVEVIDTTAPIIRPIPNVTILWPPDHELHDVIIQTNACDNSGGAVALSVEVISSEPADTDGDGNTIPDFYVDSVDSETGLVQLRLRAERSGTGPGRTYTITITATDMEENSSSAVVRILVPHDRGRIK